MMVNARGPANRPIPLLHLSNFSSDGDKTSLRILFPFLSNPCAYELACKKGNNAYRDNGIAETK